MTRLRRWSCVTRAFQSWRVASGKDAPVSAPRSCGEVRRERGSETHIVFVVVVAAAVQVGRIALRRLAATVDLRVVAVEVEVVEDGKLRSFCSWRSSVSRVGYANLSLFPPSHLTFVILQMNIVPILLASHHWSPRQVGLGHRCCALHHGEYFRTGRPPLHVRRPFPQGELHPVPHSFGPQSSPQWSTSSASVKQHPLPRVLDHGTRRRSRYPSQGRGDHGRPGSVQPPRLTACRLPGCSRQ
jgi:hypothetical protein